MNYSIYSADRTTHFKIVVVALVASIGVAGFAVAARVQAGGQYTETAHVIKAGKPGMRFAVALPARQDKASGFIGGSPALSDSQIK